MLRSFDGRCNQIQEKSRPVTLGGAACLGCSRCGQQQTEEAGYSKTDYSLVHVAAPSKAMIL
jgi:hypothetical protein